MEDNREERKLGDVVEKDGKLYTVGKFGNLLPRGGAQNTGMRGEYRQHAKLTKQVLGHKIWVLNPFHNDPKAKPEKIEVTVQLAMLYSMIHKVLKNGDVAAYNAIMDRIEGKPTIKAEMSHTVGHNMRYQSLEELRAQRIKIEAELAEYTDIHED